MKIRWKPQPKQETALRSNADEILYGGARGGGKTDTSIVKPLYHIDKPYYRALLIRKNFTDLKDWISRAEDMYKGVGGKFVNGSFVFPSGATIWLGHFADDASYQKYQGFNLHELYIEELTHLAREEKYEKLLGSVRSIHKDIKSQVFATTNPDGPGSEWVKERWGIPDKPTGDSIVTYKDIQIGDRVVRRKLEFIPSTVYDNKFLSESDDYMSYLHSIQDEELKRAWLEGSWEGFGVEGSYYKKQMDDLEKSNRIVENLYDEFLPVYTWCDLGISDSFTIGYFQYAHNQWRCIDYDEFEGESLGEAIRRMREKKYVYAEHYAPHDIEVRELGTGKSRREIAESLGLSYNVAPKLSIADGINALRMRFSQLWFDKDKTDLLRKRLKRYHKEFDEKRGVYKDKAVHDINSHGADMMRYWAVTQIYQPDIREEMRVMQNRMNKGTMK